MPLKRHLSPAPLSAKLLYIKNITSRRMAGGFNSEQSVKSLGGACIQAENVVY